MLEFNEVFLEETLDMLDKQAYLFPQFSLTKDNNKLKLLGIGGFSSVYEMYNKENPDKAFALKVIGFQRHTISSTEFWNTTRLQWILCQECKYIMRILDARELVIYFDDNLNITAVKDSKEEAWENAENCLHLQLALLEKLDNLIEKDRFGAVKLIHMGLDNESEVIRFALEIGQTLAVSHSNGCMHRDIKIENIFWDNDAKVYKLGDFGIAKCVENGTADTIVYTEGYGAPEIERRSQDSYGVTADIYSFGITLYLLLNGLRFPGSSGYYSKVEVQYNPDFIFPAPANASKEMARIIRKMCSYYSEERYQSINEVIAELAFLANTSSATNKLELIELADIATETYKSFIDRTEADVSSKEHNVTRAEQMESERIGNVEYSISCVKHCTIMTILLAVVLLIMPHNSLNMHNLFFYIIPGIVMFEALLQHLKEFNVIVGIGIIVGIVFLIYENGFDAQWLLVILAILLNSTVITMACGLAMSVWLWIDYLGAGIYFSFLSHWWILLAVVVALIAIITHYFYVRIIYGRYSDE